LNQNPSVNKAPGACAISFLIYKQTTSGQVGVPLLVHRVATAEVFGDSSVTRVGCVTSLPPPTILTNIAKSTNAFAKPVMLKRKVYVTASVKESARSLGCRYTRHRHRGS
jgi:hypothetical protein